MPRKKHYWFNPEELKAARQTLNANMVLGLYDEMACPRCGFRGKYRVSNYGDRMRFRCEVCKFETSLRIHK